MRKLTCLLLVLVMALAVVGCAPKPTPTDPTPPPPVETTLVVGTAEISGNFLSGFGNNAYDVMVRNLVFGYETYSTTPAGEIVLNSTVVKDLKNATDADGNKTYTFPIHEDLLWNDGSPVTAKDYVFYVLWYANPAWVEAGATSTVGEGLLGYADYKSGDADVFSGVQLLGDYQFSLTIDAEELPYFFETTYVSSTPQPMAVWAPDATIES
ncbi:MAG TPA: ABC transporter substrate-binding protein, partial [Bacillota bacterium]|nr:ABC transporter substrate-binding protein [Bacillota bacterium]